MKNCILFISFILSCFVFCACEDEVEGPTPDMMLLGRTFGNDRGYRIELTFESRDSVSFLGLNDPDTLMRGKARYEIWGDSLFIINPHGYRNLVDYEKTTESYFFFFKAKLQKNKFYANYQLVGVHGSNHIMGDDEAFTLVKKRK